MSAINPYSLGKDDFQDEKSPSLWTSERSAYMLPEEDYPIFAARIDRLIFDEQEKAWKIFDMPTFRISVTFDKSRKSAVYKVEVIHGQRRDDPESDPTD